MYVPDPEKRLVKLLTVREHDKKQCMINYTR